MTTEEIKLAKNASSLIAEKEKLELSRPELKQSYDEFLRSFAKFKEMASQFRGGQGQTADLRAARTKARFRA